MLEVDFVVVVVAEVVVKTVNVVSNADWIFPIIVVS